MPKFVVRRANRWHLPEWQWLCSGTCSISPELDIEPDHQFWYTDRESATTFATVEDAIAAALLYGGAPVEVVGMNAGLGIMWPVVRDVGQ